MEDDAKLASFLRRVLAEEGFTADLCASGADAVAQARAGGYELILLDWMLPDLDGLAVCRELRGGGLTTPILMLTARGELQERELGLRTGADDYLTKPFELDELTARVHALVRRAAGLGRLAVGALELDRLGHRVLLRGRPLELTVREHAFLLYLARRADQVVTRAELLAQIWDIKFDPGTNVVDVLVSRLRDKLADAAWMIDTVRGVGYCLRSERP